MFNLSRGKLGNISILILKGNLIDIEIENFIFFILGFLV